MANIYLKRVYEPYDESDGCRILVDRLWPRGISKDAARLDHWYKEIAPSPDLRKWFCHKPELFDEFRSRYIQELRTNEEKLQLTNQIFEMAASQNVTLLYGAKDTVYNHAVVLYEELMGRGDIG
ncbi:DUF488 domain-containing protein [Neobacillus rhizophilus]|uniref:DUF488 domain-containing protein n=1 Tax=Neobacillus rhizophilus TaxID=2833579 RepID=A0A942YXE1_9BACI|nr:DUF488 domain-containing protein [Neobacillus rhizophilus]MBS4213721.1 DUF488 domain-containing protein [Neobacillus rhizophilus]MBU8917874.1 DUF488 domain-containing protein [Bacillus sp. FJAT-29953]